MPPGWRTPSRLAPGGIPSSPVLVDLPTPIAVVILCRLGLRPGGHHGRPEAAPSTGVHLRTIVVHLDPA